MRWGHEATEQRSAELYLLPAVIVKVPVRNAIQPTGFQALGPVALENAAGNVIGVAEAIRNDEIEGAKLMALCINVLGIHLSGGVAVWVELQKLSHEAAAGPKLSQR